MDVKLKMELARLVADLVNGEYSALEADGRSGRLSAGELREAVRRYGRTLIPLPEDAWDAVDEFPNINDSDAELIDVPMWTKEEGRSDLTLSVAARKRGERYVLEVNDLHVL
jgi:hypothetical protein